MVLSEKETAGIRSRAEEEEKELVPQLETLRTQTKVLKGQVGVGFMVFLSFMINTRVTTSIATLRISHIQLIL